MSTVKNLQYFRQATIIFIIAILLLLVVILNISNVEIIKEIGVFLIFLFILMLIIFRSNEKLPPLIWLLMLLGFLLKCIYSYYVYKTIISPFPDSFGYLSNLEKIKHSDLTIEKVSSITGTLQFGYYYFMYFTTSFFKTTYSLYVANIFLFSLSSLMLFKLTKKDFGENIAKITTILFLCSMNIFLFTNNILKDSLVLFLVILSLYIYKKKRLVVLLIIPIVFLFTVRIYAGASVALAIIIDFIVFGKISIKKKIGGITTVVFAVIALSTFSFSSNYVAIIKSFLVGNSAIDLFINPVISLYKFFFAPLFWNLIADPGIYLITFVDSLLAFMFSFSLVLFIYKFFYYKELRKKMWIYLIPILVHAFALGIEYGGDSTRQRIGIYGFIILIFVIGLFYKKKDSRGNNNDKSEGQIKLNS